MNQHNGASTTVIVRSCIKTRMVMPVDHSRALADSPGCALAAGLSVHRHTPVVAEKTIENS